MAENCHRANKYPCYPTTKQAWSIFWSIPYQNSQYLLSGNCSEREHTHSSDIKKNYATT